MVDKRDHLGLMGFGGIEAEEPDAREVTEAPMPLPTFAPFEAASAPLRADADDQPAPASAPARLRDSINRTRDAIFAQQFEEVDRLTDRLEAVSAQCMSTRAELEEVAQHIEAGVTKLLESVAAGGKSSRLAEMSGALSPVAQSLAVEKPLRDLVDKLAMCEVRFREVAAEATQKIKAVAISAAESKNQSLIDARAAKATVATTSWLSRVMDLVVIVFVVLVVEHLVKYFG